MSSLSQLMEFYFFNLLESFQSIFFQFHTLSSPSGISVIQILEHLLLSLKFLRLWFHVFKKSIFSLSIRLDNLDQSFFKFTDSFYYQFIQLLSLFNKLFKFQLLYFSVRKVPFWFSLIKFSILKCLKNICNCSSDYFYEML